MAEVRPFRAVRYDANTVGSTGLVVAPPYDVIDEELQQRLYESHPNNIVRIIQGRHAPNDSDAENRYLRAARAYHGWLEEGVLKRDAEPGIYAYVQDFVDATRGEATPRSRLGVIALVRAEAFGQGSVLPHEQTMPGPRADRLALMRHTGAAFGQIFSLYSDPGGRTREIFAPHLEEEPVCAFADREDARHRLWRVTDDSCICDFIRLLSDKQLFIADGHHRYETSVAFRDERRSAEGTGGGERPHDFRMQTLVNMDDPTGMAIGAIHRVVTDLSGGELLRLETGVGELFEEEPVGTENPQEVLRELRRRGARGRQVYALCTGRASGWRILTLKASVDPADLDTEGHSAAWRGLSSGLLQLVLARTLELGAEELARGEKVRFVRGAPEALRMVRSGPDRAGFLLNPVDMGQLRAVVLAGERMPPKSTFFVPKVFSGLAIQDFGGF